MAIHKDAIKQHRSALKRRERNRTVLTSLRTAVKAVATAVAGKDAERARAALAEATRKLDRAVTKGVIKRNNASRKISRLTLKVKQAFRAEKSA
jgi:small subunit ribosomal protein S20